MFLLAGIAVFTALGWWMDSRPVTPAGYALDQAASQRQLWLGRARQCDADRMRELRSSNELERLWASARTTPPPDLLERAERGDAEARAVLAIFNFARGETPMTREELGAALLVEAQAGSPTAMNEVGNSHLTGEFGIPYDPEAAERWLLLAAESGDHLAMANLARSYLNGEIPAPDHTVTERLQLATDAALLAASVCDVHGLYLSSIWLTSQMTRPYDPETADYFRTLVPEQPQGNYPPGFNLAAEQMADIDTGDQEQNQ